MRRSLAFALSLVGLFDSLYLLWVYASPSRPMVCLGGGCDAVRASRYSHLWGYPTPLYGVAQYVVLALLIFAEPLLATVPAQSVRRVIAALAGAGFLTAAGLTAIEAFVLHAWCAWCVAQAIAITLVFVLSLTLLRSESRGDSVGLSTIRRHSIVLLVAAVVGVPGFAALTWRKPPEAPLPPLTVTAERLIRPDSHTTGNPDSSVVLVEFGDLQCPACAAANPEIRQLRQRFGDRVRFVFRQFPLERLHAHALRAAEASECAGQQGKFWEAVDRLYQANGDLKDSSLERYAAELGLDVPEFRACLAGDAALARVRQDTQDGLALGVRATPTFFLGQRRIEGALPLTQFEDLLSLEIATAASTAKSAPQTAERDKARDRKNAPAKPAASPSSPQLSFGAPGSTAAAGFLNVQGSSTDCSEQAPTGPDPRLIRTAEAQKLFRTGSLFVDVRSPVDFQKRRISGAVNLPLPEVGQRAGELPHDRTIVLYEGGTASGSDVCAASRAAGRVLLSHGYPKVLVYRDGLAGWQKESLPVQP